MGVKWGGDALAAALREHLEAPLAEARTLAALAAVAARAAETAEGWLAANQDPEERRRIACGPGCGTCCVLNVAVLFPEAAAVVLYLRERLAPAFLPPLLSRLDDLCREVRGLGGESPVLFRPCAFLDASGSCIVHPVRPLLCRAVTSTDPESCREAVVGDVFGETRPVLMNLLQKGVMEEAFRTFGELAEESGRDGRGLQLPMAVRRLLKEPELAEAWLAGERIAVE